MEKAIYDYENELVIIVTDTIVEDDQELIVEYTFAEWEELGKSIPPQ